MRLQDALPVHVYTHKIVEAFVQVLMSVLEETTEGLECGAEVSVIVTLDL